jgi:Lhr-like helicase
VGAEREGANQTGKTKKEVKETMNEVTGESYTKTPAELSKEMMMKALSIFMEREARREAVKAPHKEKIKKARRAKNKVARASRRGNR